MLKKLIMRKNIMDIGLKYLLIVITLFVMLTRFVIADEGIWIPMLLNKYTMDDMKAKGFRLTAEDIFDMNNSSMKDAVAVFGSECTASVISDEGLIITSHSCAFDYIQYLNNSTNNYLKDGYWAQDRTMEVESFDLSVKFLVEVIDVSDLILNNLKPDMTERERQKAIELAIRQLERTAIDTALYTKKEREFMVAKVGAFYYDTEFYMFVSRVYRDVRLVAVPPVSIGNFGGDEDKYMWPRHTGAFAIFRVYAGERNLPADYSPDNVPFQPSYYFPISMQGVEKGDFTMVFGFPVYTFKHLTSHSLHMYTEIQNPIRLKLRNIRLNIISEGMDTSVELRNKYASKYAIIRTGMKKWYGINNSVRTLNAVGNKKIEEDKFTLWANKTPQTMQKYGGIMSQYENFYDNLAAYRIPLDYVRETIFSCEAIRYCLRIDILLQLIDATNSREDALYVISTATDQLREEAIPYFEMYDLETDKRMFNTMLKEFKANVEPEFHPDI